MHVAVLGAGVAGVTTAYFLSERGCDVTVIDRASEPAAGATHANGGQLSYSFTDALASPSFLPAIPGLLLDRDPAIRIRPLTRPSLFGWGTRFLRQCTGRRARSNTLAVRELAMRSAHCLARIREQTEIRFDHVQRGKLILLPPGADLRSARHNAALKEEHGCMTSILTVEEACSREPALGPLANRFSAAAWSPKDAVGDACAYTRELAHWLEQRRGTEFRFGQTIRRLAVVAHGRAPVVQTSVGDIEADAVVVCLGTGSPEILQTVGERANIYPMRGYSITLPRGETPPAISFTDLQHRLLFCPLGDVIRIAGFADFVGCDHRRDRQRIDLLTRLAESVAPHIADFHAGDRAPWAGSRPMTPDGRPLVGATRVPGLYLNCGHGMLGWTLAAATARDVATMLAEQA